MSRTRGESKSNRGSSPSQSPLLTEVTPRGTKKFDDMDKKALAFCVSFLNRTK